MKSVLITGGSTGIGRATATRLHAEGWTVFVGVRDDVSEARIAGMRSSRMIPLRLDVTDTDSIAAAAARVRNVCPGGLSGLFNNAGIPHVGPVEFLDLDELRSTFEVNVVGQVAVTQALLPSLRCAGGRVVFTSSLSGRVAMPFMSGYAASKHALEATADSLRRELGPSVPVSLIEPGNIATPIWEKGLDPRIRAGLPAEAEHLYGQGLDFAQAQGERAARNAIAPDRVAQIVERALTARRPRRRYVVGADAHVIIPLGRFVPGVLDWVIRAGIARTPAASKAPAPDAVAHAVARKRA